MIFGNKLILMKMKVVIPDSCLACIPVYVNLPANTFHRKRVEKNLIQEKGIIKHNSAQRYIFIKFHPIQKRNQYGYFKIRNNYGATLSNFTIIPSTRLYWL